MRRFIPLALRSTGGFLVCLLLLLHPGLAEPAPPSVREYVLDQAQVLSDGEVSALEEKLRGYASRAPGRILVALEKSLPPGQQVEACALQIFQAHQGQPSDVILLITLQDRHLTLRMGSRWTGWDQRCQQLIDNTLVPALRSNDLQGGIHRTVDQVQQWLIAPAPSPARAGWLDQLPVERVFLLGVAVWGLILILGKLVGGDKVLTTLLIFSMPGFFGGLVVGLAAQKIFYTNTSALVGGTIGFLGTVGFFWLFLSALGRLFAKAGFTPGGEAWMRLQERAAQSGHQGHESDSTYYQSAGSSSGSSSTDSSSSFTAPDSRPSPSNSDGFGSGASSTW